jgi:Tfp pilus assembly protein FimT
MRRDQLGMTLIETLAIVAIVSVMVATTGFYARNWIRAERQRGAVYQLFVQKSRARVEAVDRNRPCRFLLDTQSRTLRVIDLNNVAITSDDEEISSVTLEHGVGFGRPDGGSAITLDALPGSQYEAVFAQDGSLASSVGTVGLESGGKYHRVSVYAGGGVEIERWNGSSWSEGV